MRDYFEKAGLEHTRNDTEVDWNKLKESQSEVNGHVAMLIKIFKIGKYLGHVDRIRETMLGKTCPHARYPYISRTTKGG